MPRVYGHIGDFVTEQILDRQRNTDWRPLRGEPPRTDQAACGRSDPSSATAHCHMLATAAPWTSPGYRHVTSRTSGMPLRTCRKTSRSFLVSGMLVWYRRDGGYPGYAGGEVRDD